MLQFFLEGNPKSSKSKHNVIILKIPQLSLHVLAVCKADKFIMLFFFFFLISSFFEQHIPLSVLCSYNSSVFVLHNQYYFIPRTHVVSYSAILDLFHIFYTLIYKDLSSFSLSLPSFLAWIVTVSVANKLLKYIALIDPINITHMYYLYLRKPTLNTDP